MGKGSRTPDAWEERERKRLGLRLKRAREAARIKQDELAGLLRFTFNTSVSNVELGKQPLAASDIKKLITILHRPSWWWFDDKPPRDIEEWTLFFDGDTERAKRHYEVDHGLELSSEGKEQ